MKAKIETAVFLLLICLGAIPVWEPLITCLTDMGPHNNKMNLTGLVGDYDGEHKGIKAYRWMKCNIHLYAFCFSTIIRPYSLVNSVWNQRGCMCMYSSQGRVQNKITTEHRLLIRRFIKRNGYKK